MLKHAGGWTSAAVSFSQGRGLGSKARARPWRPWHGHQGVETNMPEDVEVDNEQAAKAQIVEGTMGTSFLVEASEYGSKDDPATYQWAADQINRLSEASLQFGRFL